MSYILGSISLKMSNVFQGFLSTQAEILLGSGVERVYTLAKFDSFPHESTNFPLGDSRDINCHLIGILLLLSQLETSVSLAVNYSKFPRIVAGGTSN